MSKDVVRAGYDAIGAQYTAARHLDSNQRSLLQDLAGRLQRGAVVLDVGCGAGIPLTRWLSERFAVTGVDISEEQIRLARQSVPNARFLRQDMATLNFPDESFDAICSFYAVIHIPREEHRPLLENFHRMLKSGGLVLLCMGSGDWPGAVESFFEAPMYWSHYDAETNLHMTEEAGFESEVAEVCQDQGASGQIRDEIPGCHLLVLLGIRDKLQPAPLLESQVEDAGQLPRQQAMITARDRAQQRQPARNGIEGGLIDGNHCCREGRKALLGIGKEPSSKESRELGEQLLQGTGSRSLQAGIHRLIRDGESGIEPEVAAGEQTPERELAGKALQDTDHQPTPKCK